jgi:hypothetical protein
MCSACRYEWKPNRLPLRLRTEQWEAIIRHFINDKSSNYIATETHIERRRVLRALMVLRKAISLSVSGVLDDHTKEVLDSVSRAFPLKAARRRPLFVLLAQKNLVYATALPVNGKSTLVEKFKGEPVALSVAGWVPREEPGERYVNEVCQIDEKSQIELISNFWGYLKENLIGRGGIRYNRLPLYFAEYAWKFNHRKLSRERKLKALLNILSG